MARGKFAHFSYTDSTTEEKLEYEQYMVKLSRRRELKFRKDAELYASYAVQCINRGETMRAKNWEELRKLKVDRATFNAEQVEWHKEQVKFYQEHLAFEKRHGIVEVAA